MSFGVKGARLSFGKRGTYVNLGAGGIYYRQKVGGSTLRSSGLFNSKPNPAYAETEQQHAAADILTDIDSEKFIRELQSKANKISLFGPLGFFPLTGIGLVFLTFLVKPVPVQEEFKDVFTVSKRSVHVRSAPSVQAASIAMVQESERYEVAGRDSLGWVPIIYPTESTNHGYIRSDMGSISRLVKRGATVMRIEKEPRWKVGAILFVIAGTAWCLFLVRLDNRRKTMEINYTMDGELKQLYDKFIGYFDEFTASKMIWEELSSQEASDRKYHAGASSLVTRESLRGIFRHKLPWPHLVTNVSIPSITFRSGELYFFPERIIAKRGRGLGGALYKNVEVSISQVSFVEDSTLPPDAEVDSYTWQYLNKDGGPDRRFSGNRQLPVCKYSQYKITLDSSIGVTIMTSKRESMDNFIAFLKLIGDKQKGLEHHMR